MLIKCFVSWVGSRENSLLVGSDAAKLIGDDSISDVKNTVLAFKINQGTKFGTLQARVHIWHDFWRAVFEIQ